MIIFSTEPYNYLKDILLKESSDFFIEGEIQKEVFADGERYKRINPAQILNQNVLLIGNTANDNMLDLLDLASAIVKYGAKTLNIVIPYYAYSTMERPTKTGDVVTAKTRSRFLSAIPLAHEGNTVYFLDLHAEGIPFYTEGAIQTVHMYGKSLVKEVIDSLGDKKDIILASPDAGRAKWVESLALEFGVDSTFVLKKRTGKDQVELMAIHEKGSFKNKKILIYDDMIRTGGSLLKAAEAYRKAGASEIDVITTHGIFCDNGLEKIKNSGIVKKVYCSNSHPNTELYNKDPFLEIKDMSSILMKYLTKKYKI